MILKSDKIADLLQEGQAPEVDDPLIVSPTLDLDDLRESGSASIDLRLGTWFVTLRQARMPYLSIDGAAQVTDKPSKILGGKTIESDAQLTKTHYIPFGREYYLHKSSFVLCATLEWIRLPKNVAGYVIGRSSWGRRGLIIATAAGVHPGFTGCLTLELTNVGEIPWCPTTIAHYDMLCSRTLPHTRCCGEISRCNDHRTPGEIPIVIKPGTKICQLFLHAVESSGLGYVDQSAFNGTRKPTLGKTSTDAIAGKLAAAYQPATKGEGKE
ncbi:MAG: hypothetical protein KKE86_03150 [Planctomycetes bacterium]|nr:hypothetical protein [Planctomycetota bacterium]MBU4398314.1 hypothetical protein [Planctomycetota bacterium]MCG2682740.1 hypothetical protein [Planctomycetales bacterium]